MSMFKKNSKQKQVFTDGKTEINKKQKTILYQAFLKAGIGFIIIGLLAFAFGEIWIHSFLRVVDPQDFANRFVLIVLISGISLIIVSSILSCIWSIKPFSHSLGFTLTVWIFFILCQALGFSLIIFLFGAPFMLTAFVIAAIVCFIFSLIGYSMSKKAAITIQKIEIICLFIALSLFFGLMITSIILIITASTIKILQITLWIYFVIFSIMLLLLILSLMQLVSQLKTSSEFAQITNNSDQKLAGKISWFFGYILLSQFVQILWYIVYILIILSAIKRR